MSVGLASYALVTGAAGGIGRAIARVFHEADYHVITTDRSRQPEGPEFARYIQADLERFAGNEMYATDIVHRIHQHLHGCGLDTLVNNAAIQILGSSDNLTRQNWRTTLDVNLLSPFLLTQALLPELEKAKGCVVNISSIHARLTKRNFVAYATSKAALSGLTRAMAIDLGPRVRVNAIEPAAIETEMLRAGFEEKPEFYRQLEACHPQGRIGTPEEVARLTLAAVAGDMKFLHGACLSIDGAISNRLLDPE